MRKAKKLKFCHKLTFSNFYMFAAWWCKQQIVQPSTDRSTINRSFNYLSVFLWRNVSIYLFMFVYLTNIWIMSLEGGECVYFIYIEMKTKYKFKSYLSRLRYILIYPDISWYILILIYPDISSYILKYIFIYPNVSWCILIYPDISWYILKYPDISRYHDKFW